jgi:hypothetical protein
MRDRRYSGEHIEALTSALSMIYMDIWIFITLTIRANTRIISHNGVPVPYAGLRYPRVISREKPQEARQPERSVGRGGVGEKPLKVSPQLARPNQTRPNRCIMPDCGRYARRARKRALLRPRSRHGRTGVRFRLRIGAARTRSASDIFARFSRLGVDRMTGSGASSTKASPKVRYSTRFVSRLYAAVKTSISRAKLTGAGAGSPNSRRVRRWPWIASRMFRSVSSRVLPVEMQPGRSGT